MNIDSFASFIEKRTAPCVFAFVSDEAKNQFPNYKEMITIPWKEALEKTKTKFRMLFLDDFITLESIIDTLNQVENDSKPYSGNFKQDFELNTTKVLRQQLLEYDFLPFYFFCDLPIGILAVVSGSQLPNIPLGSFPHWARPIIEKTKANSLKLPANDPVTALSKWITLVLNKRCQQETTSVKIAYEKTWNASRSFTALFEQKKAKKDKEIDIKFYADWCLQQHRYKDASEAYALIVNNSSNTVGNEMAAEASFLLAICDIMRSEVNQQTVFAIQTSIKLIKTSIHLSKCALLEFYIKKIMKVNPINSLKPLCMEPASKLMKIVYPFAMIQIAHLMRPKHAVKSLSETSPIFHEIGCSENALNASKRVISELQSSEWDFLYQKVISETNEFGKTSEKSKEILASSKIAFINESFEQVLKGKPWRCGFIQAKVHSFISEGFICTKPVNFNDEWNNTVERLFGAYRPNSFFISDLLNQKECIVGEKVIIRTVIKTHCSNVSISHLRLKIKGCSVDLTEISTESQRVIDTSLSFIPKEAGKLTVVGIEFKWGNEVDFFVDFDNPMEFTVYERAPYIEMTTEERNFDVFVDEITPIQVKIKNSEYPITKMLLYLTGINMKLIDSSTVDVRNQYSLDPLKPNEERTLQLVFTERSSGVYHCHILLSYWNAKEGPARYSSIHLTVNVKELPTISVLQNEGSLGIKVSCGDAIGFTSPRINTENFTSIDEYGVLTLHTISQDLKFKTALPDYVLPFYSNDKFKFWFATKTGVVSVPIKISVHPIQVLIERTEYSEYKIYVKNVGNRLIKDIKIIIIGDEDPVPFFISGKEITIIEELEQSHEVIIPINFVLFQKKTTANLLVYYETFFISKRIVIY